jgi:hypothetical protein
MRKQSRWANGSQKGNGQRAVVIGAIEIEKRRHNQATIGMRHNQATFTLLRE